VFPEANAGQGVLVLMARIAKEESSGPQVKERNVTQEIPSKPNYLGLIPDFRR
jgi:hypothetical protein